MHPARGVVRGRALELGEFRDYLGTLFTRKWTVIAFTLLGLLGSIGFVRTQTPTYTSTARVLATNPLAAFVPLNSLAQPNMADEQARVGSLDVLRCAEQFIANVKGADVCAPDKLAKVSLTRGLQHRLSISVSQNTNILRISFSSPNPARAQLVAQAVAQAYVTVKLNDAMAYLDANKKPLLDAENKLSTEISDLGRDIDHAISDAARTGRQPNTGALQARLLQKGNELQVVSAQLIDLSSAKINPPRVELPASLPSSPSSPKVPLDLAIGVALGLLLGLAVALVQDSMSDRLRSRDEVEEYAGAQVLAVVPKARARRWGRRDHLITLAHPSSAFSETYRALRARILFSAAHSGLKVVMVASASPGEGKSTVAANLAVVLAEAGRRVILISADLRRPSLAKPFDLDDQIGLSNLLDGQCQLSEALQESATWNLWVITSGGPVLDRPADLLQSEAMADIISQVRELADFVIIDTPPILLVSDALSLAPMVDGIVLVVRAGETTRTTLWRARMELAQVHGPVIGTVMNASNALHGEFRRYRDWAYGFPYRPA
jgi:capsular exopolysaccharide synthesis family protein